MRILWVSNSPIGPVAKVLNKEYGGTSGGWIQSEYEQLEQDNKYQNQFYFLTTSPHIVKGSILHNKNEFGEAFCINSPKLTYGISISKKMQKEVDDILARINPDVIHIWGTETWLSYAVSKSICSIPKVVFIQGLIGVHCRYRGGYFENYKENKTYINDISWLNKIKDYFKKKYFNVQAEIEKNCIKNCGNVIVDSDFARAYCYSLSNEIVCYQHALLPNKIFYSKTWSLSQCKQRRIFTIYGSSADKGTHNLLRAVSILKKKYPDIVVSIPGNYETDASGKLVLSKNNPFQRILYKMIDSLQLGENIVFVGKLNPQQMADELQKCHLFVNTSCMEVHSLSLREAMVEGVPCITTLCGSIGEFVKHKENGLIYRYEEFESLAHYIDYIFSNDELTVKISENAKRAFDYMITESKSLEMIYEDMSSKKS